MVRSPANCLLLVGAHALQASLSKGVVAEVTWQTPQWLVIWLVHVRSLDRLLSVHLAWVNG